MMMKVQFVATLMLLCAGIVFAKEAKPTWALGKNSINSKGVKGKVELVDGVVKLDGTNSFAIPAKVLGSQKNYSIEFEFKRSPNFQNLSRMEGALRLISNRDLEKNAGLSLIYFPPAWDLNGGVSNLMGIEINGYWNGECGGLSNNNFDKYSVVVKDKIAAIYRNGLLLAMTGAVNPSTRPLTIGGQGWRGGKAPEDLADNPVPEPYEMRNLKIYNRAVFPTGYDRSAETMLNCAGEGYTMQRALVKDHSLPRILVIGDSISMGYRGFITEHFKGTAYVDYWVGRSTPWGSQSSDNEDAESIRSWNGVLSNGPYDVISWNAMTLHWWTPQDKARCPESMLAPRMTRMVAFLRKAAPKTKIIWIRSTPIRACLPNGSHTLDNADNARIIKYNDIVDGVMKKETIPEVDLYAIAEEQIHTVPQGLQDHVHWSSDVSRLFADMIILEINKHLPKKHMGKK